MVNTKLTSGVNFLSWAWTLLKKLRVKMHQNQLHNMPTDRSDMLQLLWYLRGHWSLLIHLWRLCHAMVFLWEKRNHTDTQTHRPTHTTANGICFWAHMYAKMKALVVHSTKGNSLFVIKLGCFYSELERGRVRYRLENRVLENYVIFLLRN